MAGVDSKARLDLLVAQQVKVIADAFRAERKIEIVVQADGHGGMSFLCHPSQILVRYDYLEDVQRVLGQETGPRQVQPVIAGVVLLTLDIPALEKKVPLDGRPPVIAALDAVDAALGEGIATPDHILTVCGVVSPCPATEPRMVEDRIEPHPGICTGNSGAGVLVYLADTGLLEGADADHSWLHGVKRAPGQGWDPNFQASAPYIGPYAGHGTFVAGVVRCMAPQADVIVSNVFDVGGSALESDFVKDLRKGLKLGVDVFNLAVSAPSRNDLPLLAFEGWLKLLAQYKGVACIVAAGNSGVRTPSWPAAFAQVVAVGALTADGRDRADFSNHGGWVDVYAPGRDLINAYATGSYQYQDEPYQGGPDGKFFGMARWSGTSFSTPIVTGLIAARMSRTGENGLEAAAALLQQARAQAIPGVGAVTGPCTGENHSGHASTGHRLTP
jgi:subtilisin family serine protease